MVDPSSVSPSHTSKVFTSFGSAIDLRTAVPTGGVAQGQAARRLRIGAVGASPTITLENVDGSTTTLTDLVANEVFDMQIHKILSVVNVTSVTVFW